MHKNLYLFEDFQTNCHGEKLRALALRDAGVNYDRPGQTRKWNEAGSVRCLTALCRVREDERAGVIFWHPIHVEI